jgi:signal peptidase I
MRKRPVLILGALVGLLVIASFYLWLRLYFVGVPSAGMEPTIRRGDRIVVDSRVGDIARGRIIMFRPPLDPPDIYIKRVVGVGGDVVHLRGTRVIVNGEPLRERRIFVVYGDEREVLREVGREGEGEYSVYYAKAESDEGREFAGGEYATREPYRVPEGHLFMLGDNRDDSFDSRYWGPVPVANVMGRPLYVYVTETDGEGSLTHRTLR